MLKCIQRKINKIQIPEKSPEYFYLVTSHRWYVGPQDQIQVDPGSSSSVSQSSAGPHAVRAGSTSQRTRYPRPPH